MYKGFKIIILLLILGVGICHGQNDSIQLGHMLAKDTTLLHQAHTDALRDSTTLDRIKADYVHALELEELAELEKSATLRRASYQYFVKVLTMLEEIDIPYKEYYAASAFHAGNIQYNSGNYGTAYSCFEVAHKYSPKNTEYLMYMAYMNEHYEDAARNRIAIDNYKELVKLDPERSDYHLHLYYLYGKQHNYKAAKKELDIYTHTEGESVQSIEPYLNLFDAMNKPAKAIDYLKGFIVRNPASRMEAELYLSRYLLRHDNNSEAFAYLFRNLGNLPTHDLSTLLNPYVQTMLETKDTARVVAFLDTLQSLHNDKLEVFQYSYDVLQSINDTSKLFPVLQRMYQLGKEDEKVFMSLADYYQAHDMNEEFREISARGDSLFSNETWTYLHIVTAFDTARLAQFISLATGNVDRLTNKAVKSIVYTLLAESYGMAKEKVHADSTEQALRLRALEMAAYDSALLYNPDNSEALNNYAYNIATADNATDADLLRAERMAARAVKLDPSATHVLDTYAWVLHLRGDDLTASIYINKLIRQSEADGDTMTVIEYYHIYSILAPIDVKKGEKYLELLREQYRKNPDAVGNDRKAREEIEKLL